MEDQLDRLRALALRHGQGQRTDTPIPRVSIHRRHEPTPMTPGVLEPVVCLVLQGAKEVMLGERVLRYDPASYFVASLELAASGRVVEASADEPYLCLSLLLDRDALAGLLSDAPAPRRAPSPASRASA